jgi:hypothetical protein
MMKPRRVHRRLLLPPGWVALGFLLLLGCQALQPWHGQLKLWNVLQVTMPPLKANTSYLRFLKSLPASKIRNKFDPYATPLPTISTSVLQNLRPWHTVEFSGHRVADFLSEAAVESATRKIIADTGHAGGVRVRFRPGATYANLVSVLDIMLYTDQKKYFLDIHHQPVTLYAITSPSTNESKPLSMCGFIGIAPPAPVEHTIRQLLINFEQEIGELRKQAWRWPILVLFVISGLNLWRLLHSSRSCHNTTYHA